MKFRTRIHISSMGLPRSICLMYRSSPRNLGRERWIFPSSPLVKVPTFIHGPSPQSTGGQISPSSSIVNEPCLIHGSSSKNSQNRISWFWSLVKAPGFPQDHVCEICGASDFVFNRYSSINLNIAKFRVGQILVCKAPTYFGSPYDKEMLFYRQFNRFIFVERQCFKSRITNGSLALVMYCYYILKKHHNSGRSSNFYSVIIVCRNCQSQPNQHDFARIVHFYVQYI